MVNLSCPRVSKVRGETMTRNYLGLDGAEGPCGYCHKPRDEHGTPPHFDPVTARAKLRAHWLAIHEEGRCCDAIQAEIDFDRSFDLEAWEQIRAVADGMIGLLNHTEKDK